MKNEWLAENPAVKTVATAAVDLNGQARGKRMPANHAARLFEGSGRMPLSTLNVDILGNDIKNSPLVYETGDRDGVLKPTERGFVLAPWMRESSALLPITMHTEDGAPFAGDPRHSLAAVLERYSERGWSVVAATELEFYLVEAEDDAFVPPSISDVGRLGRRGDYMSLQALDKLDDFFSDLYSSCQKMGIEADAACSEAGLGQFEINLNHGPAMKAADDTWLFKQLVRGLARNYGLYGTFMSKPFSDQPGSGLHVHFSVVDEKGENVFDNGGDRGTDNLLYAVGGLLNAMSDSTLVFAPHGNSYTRMVQGSHAPTGVAWAYENRTAALRIPASAPRARRIEHRVSGGDVNPYLILTAILGAALNGITSHEVPPKPIQGNAYTLNLLQLPSNWETAIDSFENSPIIRRLFPEQLITNFALTKRQEKSVYDDLSDRERIALYLEYV